MLFKNGAVATQRPCADDKPHGWDELLDYGQTIGCVSKCPRNAVSCDQSKPRWHCGTERPSLSDAKTF